MTRTRTSAVSAAFLLAAAVALFLVLMTGKSSGGPSFIPKLNSSGNETETVGVGRLGGYEAYRAASRTYPAKSIPVSVTMRGRATFNRIARADNRRVQLARKSGRRFAWDDGSRWKLYGPRINAVQPGVISFSGATNATASRTVALVVSPDCGRHGRCTLWSGVSGGGVWRTDNALAASPSWEQVSPQDLDQNSVGALVLDPRDQETLYLGTGEGNRCSSGCEAGVGIYKSTDDGDHWKHLAGACVSNATYACVNPGKDSFLGRGINGIVIDPRNSKHIFVASAQAVRGLSHVIGNGGTTRLEPGANDPGLYESFDGGKTFTEVWNGSIPGGFGASDVGLDPLNLNTVYASAFDAGVWRRDAGAASTAFTQVFAPEHPGGGTNRSMFALTIKNGHTRIYLTDGTVNQNGPLDPTASTFWRTDRGDQPASTLLGSEPAGSTAPDPVTHAFPASYTGWQKLSSGDSSNPYYATIDFCWAQCWYDQDVYTPAGMPDTVYVIGANQYGEQPCNTKGVGCGSGVSNGREVLYSNTAGDPDSANGSRTFSDLSYDAQDTTAPWCAYLPYDPTFACLRAPNGIHPDQHEIVVNPSNPTQIFEGSDGGVIRTNGAFSNISSQCDEPSRGLAPGSPDYMACKRLLSRVPTALAHVDRNLSSTLQFINVAINPSMSCEVMGGTQDNGTWSNNNGCSRNTFNQVIYGDGGNAVYDATNGTWRANGFTSGFGDSNFRNGDPEKWVITTAPITRSGEGPAFYWPQVGDPNPATGTHPIYEGAKHVWRSWAFGAGTPRAVPQNTSPDIAFYESQCPEFVTSGTNSKCGDFQPLGGPYCDVVVSTPFPSCLNQPGDLTGSFYGADRAHSALSPSSLSWVARGGGDHGTIWAATNKGRIFVTHQGDASDPSTVEWHRIDNPTSPSRFPSGIYVDPADSSHAWVTYSGYNATTTATPGHVFEVRENGSAPGSGIFTNLNVEAGGTSSYPTPFSDGDLPVSDIARDDATHTLYVSTDFGVLVGKNDGHSGWHVTSGMPRYEVMHLAIQPSSREATCTGTGHCERVLYAATHSQGIWKMKLSGHDDGDDDDHGDHKAKHS